MRWPWSKPVSVMSERLRCLLIQTITRWRSRRRTMVRAKRSSRFLLLKGFVSDLSAELIATRGSRQQVSSTTVPWASSNGCDKCATRQNIQTTIGRQRRAKTWLKPSMRPFGSSTSVLNMCAATSRRRIPKDFDVLKAGLHHGRRRRRGVLLQRLSSVRAQLK